jgi:acetyltransferase
MEFFFNPKGVAVIGATENRLKGGYHLLRNVIESYKGKVYPVNPRYASLMDMPCYPDVASIPDDFDIAVYFIPAPGLYRAIEECASKNVKGIIIESAGFAEVGAEGRKLQEECVLLARKHGIRLWGPNCMGLLDSRLGHVFSFMYMDAWKTLLKPGNVSMIVQSGMLSAGFLLMVLERGGMAISKMCSIGNKCDVNETELLEFLVDDPATDAIGLYAESIAEPRRFLSIASGTDKPIVLVKGGRSPGGAKAAMSHTASMAGNYRILQSAMKQAGVIEATDFNEMMDILKGFSKTRSFSSFDTAGTVVVTFSGGGGIVTSDMLYESGLSLAELNEETLAALKTVFPPWMDPANPVDIWPAIEYSGVEKVFSKVSEAVMKDPGVNSVIIHIFAFGIQGTFFNNLAKLKDDLGKPVVVWLAGLGDYMKECRTILEDLGIPVFDEMSRTVSVLSALKSHFQRQERP